MLRQNGLQQEDETFVRLVSTYGACENTIFFHLGLNSLPWQPYCQEVFTLYLLKIERKRQFQHDVVL